MITDLADSGVGETHGASDLAHGEAMDEVERADAATGRAHIGEGVEDVVELRREQPRHETGVATLEDACGVAGLAGDDADRGARGGTGDGDFEEGDGGELTAGASIGEKLREEGAIRLTEITGAKQERLAEGIWKWASERSDVSGGGLGGGSGCGSGVL